MSMILRVPARSNAYLIAEKDSAQDKFDVTKFAFNYPLIANVPTPWAYWKMEEVSGSRFDSIANREMSVLVEPVDGVVGKVGNCAWLHREAYVGNPPRLRWNPTYNPAIHDRPETTPWTWSFWFKWGTPNVNGDDGLEAWILGGWVTIDLYNCAIDGSGLEVWINCDFFSDGFVWDSGSSPRLLYAKDIWHFWCLYFDGSKVHLEINNVEIFVSNVLSLDPSKMMYWYDFGMYNGWNITPMWIDEYTMWDVGLTKDQREAVYNNGAGRLLI